MAATDFSSCASYEQEGLELIGSPYPTGGNRNVDRICYHDVHTSDGTKVNLYPLRETVISQKQSKGLFAHYPYRFDMYSAQPECVEYLRTPSDHCNAAYLEECGDLKEAEPEISSPPQEVPSPKKKKDKPSPKKGSKKVNKTHMLESSQQQQQIAVPPHVAEDVTSFMEAIETRLHSLPEFERIVDRLQKLINAESIDKRENANERKESNKAFVAAARLMTEKEQQKWIRYVIKDYSTVVQHRLGKYCATTVLALMNEQQLWETIENVPTSSFSFVFVNYHGVEASGVLLELLCKNFTGFETQKERFLRRLDQWLAAEVTPEDMRNQFLSPCTQRYFRLNAGRTQFIKDFAKMLGSTTSEIQKSVANLMKAWKKFVFTVQEMLRGGAKCASRLPQWTIFVNELQRHLQDIVNDCHSKGHLVPKPIRICNSLLAEAGITLPRILADNMNIE